MALRRRIGFRGDAGIVEPSFGHNSMASQIITVEFLLRGEIDTQPLGVGTGALGNDAFSSAAAFQNADNLNRCSIKLAMPRPYFTHGKRTVDLDRTDSGKRKSKSCQNQSVFTHSR